MCLLTEVTPEDRKTTHLTEKTIVNKSVQSRARQNYTCKRIERITFKNHSKQCANVLQFCLKFVFQVSTLIKIIDITAIKIRYIKYSTKNRHSRKCLQNEAKRKYFINVGDIQITQIIT